MPDDFEIRKTEDGHVIVILHPACTISKNAILALLAELGIDEMAVVFLLPEDVVNRVNIADLPVVIPIDEAVCDAKELDAAGRQCGQAGGCVIILLGKGFPYKGLHPIAEKYGTQCGWFADKLGDCLKSPCSAPPSGSDGTEIPRPKHEPVKC